MSPVKHKELQLSQENGRKTLYPRTSHRRVDVLGWLGAGMSESEILEEHPDLEKAVFPAVYHYASGRQGDLDVGNS